MSADGNAPKNEFSNFLDDIAEEISQRVESLTPPARPAGKRTASSLKNIAFWIGRTWPTE